MNSIRIHSTLGALAVALSLSACGLIGVEPDEIDIADEDTGTSALTTDTATGEGTESGDGDGDANSTSGDGDGDPGTSTGDGDGDPATTTGGDGDGDPTTSTGDGDGDPTSTGGSEDPCSNHAEDTALVLGENMVTVGDQPSIVSGECGSDGPEVIHPFTAGAAGFYSFTLLDSPDIIGALYIVEEVCDPVAPLAECAMEDVSIDLDLAEGQAVYVVVDADVPGSATVTITGP